MLPHPNMFLNFPRNSDLNIPNYESANEVNLGPDEECGPPCTRHQAQNDMQSHYWKIASDNSHPGLHEQIHFAEAFLCRQITNEEIGTIP